MWLAGQQILEPWQEKMSQTKQNPRWHGEGDVLTHTRMVCQALPQVGLFTEASEETKRILWLAALLHDLGKTVTTILENGQWTSSGHARKGAEMVRQYLWQEWGLCGTVEKQRLRETVCTLIRYHSLPPYAIENEDGKLRLLRASANGALMPGFTMECLCALSEADALGRICEGGDQMLEQIELCRELADEAGCYRGSYLFPSDHTAFACWSGKQIALDYSLYDDSWGQVILMSGLPGTGKDTWIGQNCGHMPMVSLDEIRVELGISPRESQGKVIDTARERAREYLRRKIPFVWNATNISMQTRQQQIGMFQDYGASVRVVYLETDWQEQLRRNRDRKDRVPEVVICDMLRKLTPPERWEAQRVEWICV